MNRRSLALLTAGHFCTDLTQGALPALLPVLMVQHHFSYAAAAGLVLMITATSSLMQPLFGEFADRVTAPWLVPLGVCLSGAGLALVGVAPSYSTMLGAIAISGLGLAVFHPEGARLVNVTTADRRATGMSLFAVGGNAGFAVGPLLATIVVAGCGLSGTLLLFVPVALVAISLVRQLPQLGGKLKQQTDKDLRTATQPDAWKPFACLTAIVVCRSIAFFGLNTFLPLYWITVLQQSKAAGSAALTVMLVSGAIGTLIGGRLADRYGRFAVVLAGVGLLLPLIPALLNTTDVRMATGLLVLIGVALFAPFSVMVVMGQEYLPNRVGVASGVTLGLAGSVGGLLTPVLGWVADDQGLHTALMLLIGVAIVAFGLSLQLLRLHQRWVVDFTAHPQQ